MLKKTALFLCWSLCLWLPLRSDGADTLVLRDTSDAFSGTKNRALLPWTTLYMNGTGVLQDLTLGAAGYVLTSAGTASAPVWASKAHAMTGAEHTAGNWKVFYSNGSGAVVELPLGAANYVLSSTGTDAAPQWSALPVLVESDPVYSASAASSVTGAKISNWDAAYGWGDHAGLYLPLGGGTLTGPLVLDVNGVVEATIDEYGVDVPSAIGTVFNFTNSGDGAMTLLVNGATVWNADNDGTGSGLDADLLDGSHAAAFAASGHNHSGVYVESESDPVYTASAAASVTGTKIGNWDTAYGWGNHASAGYWVLGSTQLSGDVTGLYGATAVGDDSHAHTGATLSSIDISADTNLSGDTEIVLTDDALSLGAGVARDSEVAAGYQPLNASLSAIAGQTWPGATSITTLGTITTGAWNAGGVTSSGLIIASNANGSARLKSPGIIELYRTDASSCYFDLRSQGGTLSFRTYDAAPYDHTPLLLYDNGQVKVEGATGFGVAPVAAEGIVKLPAGTGVANGIQIGAPGYSGNLHTLTGVGLVLQALGTDADGDNVAVKLKDAAGASYFYVLDSTGAVVGSWNSDGAGMFGGSLQTLSNIYLGDGTNFKAIYIDARAGGNLVTDATKRLGALSNANSILTLNALNNGSVRVVDDSSNGMTIADGGAATFSSTISASNMTGGANPTASVNGTAVNGSATTFMRSDAAPPIANPLTPTGGYQGFTGGVDCSTDVKVGRNLIGTGSAPSIVKGDAIIVGNNPTVAIAGNDLGGKIDITPDAAGQSAGTPGTMATVTYATAFATASHVVLMPATEAATWLTTGSVGFWVETTASGFALKYSSPYPTDSGETYSWHYIVVGR